ncbi:MAG: hypothetical protein HPY66_1237 [Firmicutes bacterium]|nr:hypothetical protein [Bacillota bacterium]
MKFQVFLIRLVRFKVTQHKQNLQTRSSMVNITIHFDFGAVVEKSR